MNEATYQVITLAPGEARVLQLAGGDWVCVVGVAETAGPSASDPATGPTNAPSGEFDYSASTYLLDYAASTYSTDVDAATSLPKPPSTPTWGTVMFAEPIDALSGVAYFDESLFKMRFEPNPGTVDIPGLHVVSPQLADAIKLDRTVEFGGVQSSGIE